ncbi:MAG: hypothetical protein K2G77_07705 [Muribaculaceae bacterium]|nr:hypothetical protein [Muribaculaceae bacterium]
MKENEEGSGVEMEDKSLIEFGELENFDYLWKKFIKYGTLEFLADIRRGVLGG